MLGSGRICLAYRRLKNTFSSLLPTVLFAFSASGSDVKLENSKVAFCFSPELDFALVEIINKETNRSINFEENAPGVRGLWEIKLIDGDVEHSLASGRDEVTHELTRNDTGSELVISWDRMKAGNSKTRVAAHIFLPDNAAIAQWSINITVSGVQAPWVKTVRFPLLRGIKSLGDDYLVTGEYIGRIIRNPGKRLSNLSICSPGTWAMQFVAFHGSEQLKANNLVDLSGKFKVNGFYRGPASDETGLFFSAADGNGWIKRLNMNRTGRQKEVFNLEMEHYPSFPFWPPDKRTRHHSFDYEMPYKIMLGTFSGGTGDACSLYRKWALDQPWMSRGPVRKPLDHEKNAISSKVLDCAFWGKFYHEAGKVVPELAQMYSYLRVPMNTHWYRYYINHFDDNNPEYFPVDSYYREAVRDLKKMSIGVMPYVCCAVWDLDLKSWQTFNMKSAAATSEAGMPYIWHLYGKQPNAWMNPASKLWQEKFGEATRKMFQDWGADGEYLDVLAATDPLLCYNDKLHNPHGGTYWSDGNRKLLEKLRKDIRQVSKETFLSSEGFCENYIDLLDAFLILDITRYGWKNKTGYDIYPLFSMVYHDYAITYGSDCNQKIPPEMHRWQMGLCYAWGIQPTYGATAISKPQSVNAENDIFTRKIVRSWHQSGGKFLTGGRGVETAMIPTHDLIGEASAAIISPPASISIKEDLDFQWTGPSVLGSTWFAADGTLGCVLVNITSNDTDAEVVLDVGKLGMNGKELWRSWPLPSTQIGKIADRCTMPVKVPAASPMVFELRDNTKPEIKPLSEAHWKLVNASEKGTFEPVETFGGHLWGCTDSIVENVLENKNNILKIISFQTNSPRHIEKTVEWGVVREGYGKDRKIDDKPFYLLEPSPFKLDGDAHAFVRFHDNAIFGKMSVKSPSTMSGLQGAVIILAREKNRPVLHREKAQLQPGEYRFAAWAADNDLPLPDGKNLMESLSDISIAACEKGKRKTGRARMVPESDQKAAAKLLFIGNAAACAAIGAECVNMMTYDWILPLIPSKIEYKVSKDQGAILSSSLANLRTDLHDQISIKKAKENLFSLTAICDSAAGNLMPILFNCVIHSDGFDFAVNNLSHVEIDRPIMVDMAQCRTPLINVVPGTTVQNCVFIRNVSPHALDVKIAATLPDGWSIKFKETKDRIHLDALSSTNLTFEIKTVKEAGKEKYEVELSFNYTENDDTVIVKPFDIIMAVGCDVVPVDSSPFKKDPPWSPPQRFDGQMVIFSGSEKSLTFTAKTAFEKPNNSFSWQLVDAEMKPVKSGVIPKAKFNIPVTVKLPVEGVYNLRYTADFFHVKVEKPKCYGYWAHPYRPFILFADKSRTFTLYFHVPEDAKRFEISGVDGGRSETAEITIITPDGKTVYAREGAWLEDKWFSIPVTKQFAGTVWSLKICAVEDLKFKMRGDVMPCLSPTPDSVLKKNFTIKSGEQQGR